MQGEERAASSRSPFQIQFPLLAGKKYSIREKWENNKGESRLDATVEGMEEVEVPAGKFKAWKISFSGPRVEFGSNEVQGQLQGTLWYSPEVKRLVKTDTTNHSRGRAFQHPVITLLEWTPGPSAQK